MTAPPKRRSARQCTCWWHRLTIGAYDERVSTWNKQLENTGLGYKAESAEFRADHPHPTFKEVLLALKQTENPSRRKEVA